MEDREMTQNVRNRRSTAIRLGIAAFIVAGVSVGGEIAAERAMTAGQAPATRTAATCSSTAAQQAWLDYRAGERADLAPANAAAAQAVARRAWLDYRAGERGDVAPANVAAAQALARQAWLDYRAGERADLPSNASVAQAFLRQAFQDYRAAERSDLAPANVAATCSQ
jgi:pimeloyl-ACP methyl ester carboxylesterase